MLFGFFVSFIPPPYQTRCSTMVTWKSKLSFPEIPLLPKGKKNKKKKKLATRWKLRVIEICGERAALPKKSLFKGFKKCWEWCSIS